MKGASVVFMLVVLDHHSSFGKPIEAPMLFMRDPPATANATLNHV
jgi:hypothetical protein